MRRRSSSQINRPLSLRWSLTGILLLLAMFGHDAFMAAEPEATAGGVRVEEAVDVLDGRVVHAAFDEAIGPLPDAHVSHADAGCGVNTSPASFQSRFFSILSLPVAVGLPDLPVAITHGTESPVDHVIPPSDRRALLQVYLI